MAETTVDTSTQDGKDPGGATSDAGDEFKAITSQDELNRIIGERVRRAKPADYDDLKAKAGRLDQIEQANKSEAEKLTEARAAAERERDDARAEALRLRIATKNGISDEDADLFLTGKDEETLTRQAQRLAGRDADRKKQGNYMPREGVNPTATPGEGLEMVRSLFGGG